MHVVYIYMNFIVILMLFLVLNNETEFYDDVHNPDYVFNTLQIKGWHISPEEQVKVYRLFKIQNLIVRICKNLFFDMYILN